MPKPRPPEPLIAKTVRLSESDWTAISEVQRHLPGCKVPSEQDTIRFLVREALAARETAGHVGDLAAEIERFRQTCPAPIPSSEEFVRLLLREALNARQRNSFNHQEVGA